ncbi:hypothetical protein F4778DRAFT_787079 [Xylariomycetidae sp. FL2044]|nr:hypothetical protein F4778DRAFT_787079 [Xylariomycetidae sp. FL2044]
MAQAQAQAQDRPADPAFSSIAQAAASDWYSQRSASPHRSHSSHGQVRSSQQQSAPAPAGQQTNGAGQPASTSSGVHSDITAWQSALKCLPDDMKNSHLPIHPLAQALAPCPTLRPVEWNQYRQNGGFVPRTPHDYSSLMIFLSGQVSPNPCRNCLLQNGPFARCVVAPPEVLAQSHLKHACANCTYQNQYKKCTNAAVTEEEMAKNRMTRAILKSRPQAPRKPKPPKPPKPAKIPKRDHHQQQPQYQAHDHVTHKPAASSISAESFVNKLQQARSWSPRSRRRMRAEALQWQAAIATVEAENTRTFPQASSYNYQRPRPSSQSTSMRPPPSQPSTSTAMFAPAPAPPPPPPPSIPPSSMPPVSHYGMEAGDYGEEEEDQEMIEEYETGSDEEHEYEGTSWVGFDGSGPAVKPAVP